MIRQATPGDASEVAAIWNWMISDTLLTFTSDTKSTDAVGEIIAARQGRFLVCDRDGCIEGFATFAPFRAGPGYARACEHSVIVAPAHVSRGVGRALMTLLIDIARADRQHVIIAAISGENPDAVAFHERLGFAQTAQMPEIGYKNGRYLDLILMQKMLGPVAS